MHVILRCCQGENKYYMKYSYLIRIVLYVTK